MVLSGTRQVSAQNEARSECCRTSNALRHRFAYVLCFLVGLRFVLEIDVLKCIFMRFLFCVSALGSIACSFVPVYLVS
jgi:hypothetical protein